MKLFGNCIGTSYSDQEVLPHLPLLPPIENGRDGPDHDLTDGSSAALRAGQEEDILMDVRGQFEQVHDLRDSGTGDVTEPGDLGLVGNLPRLDQPVEADGQSHQTRDGSGWYRLSLRRRAFLDDLATAMSATDVELSLNRQALSHARASCSFSSSVSVLMPVGWNVIETLPFSPS